MIYQLKLKIEHIEDLNKLVKLSKIDGKTKIKFQISDDDNIYLFVLKDKRKIDNNLINELKIRENIIVD